MRRIFLLLIALSLFSATPAIAGFIKYIGNGKGGPAVKVSYCRGNSSKWEHRTMKPGQMLSIPKDATHLTINGSPRNPQKDYKIQDGNVF